MLSQLNRLLTRKSSKKRIQRQRSLLRSLEQLENRQLLAADLDFSTFYPSTGAEDGVASVTQDSQGNAYVVDYSYDPVTFDIESAAISKLSPTGELLWSQQTQEYAYDLAVDDDGFVYLISATVQDGLTVTPDAPQPTRAGGYDFYAMVLDGNAIDADSANISSSELVFASYLGGSGDEDTTHLSLAVSPDGGFVIGGSTASIDFPTTNQPAVDSTYGGGANDGIVARFQPTTGGNYDLQLSTYLGDSETDWVRDVGVDATGTTHVVGQTSSINFPLTSDAIQTEFANSYSTRIGFVTRLGDDGGIQYSTFLGGGLVQDVAVDPVGNTYVVGAGPREGFPVTPGAYAPDEVFASDGVTRLNGQFISKIDASGALEHSSWFQPSRGLVFAYGAQINLDGDRPVLSGYDSGGSPQTSFFIRFDSDFSRIVDRVTVDSDTPQYPWIASSNFVDGSFYVGGFTDNPAFETTSNAIFPAKNTGLDGYVRKYTLGTPPPPPVQIEANDNFDNGTPNGGMGPWTGPWALGSNTSFITSGGPNDGTTHAIIQRRGSLTRKVDSAGITDLNLSFASKLRSFENSDNAYVRVSPDGSNWTTLKTFGNGEDDNMYRDYSYDIPFESDVLWIRFEGDMSSSRYDYWYVDTVRVTGTVASQPPVAVSDNASTAEDLTITVDVLVNDSDPEGEPLSIASVTQPTSGSATIVGGQIQYTPNANFNGLDSFTYTITDTAGQTASATVEVTTTPVNDAPVSVGDSVTTREDSAITFDVLGNDFDVDDDSLSVQSATNGSSGSVTVNPNNTLTYSPNAGFFGTDTFTYTITDGNGGTASADVTVTVDERNDPPAAINDTVATDEDVSLLVDVLANDSDPDGDSLTIQSISQPASGTASTFGGQVQYSPNANFSGSDSFTYTIVDTAGNTATASVDVTIAAVNDPPVAVSDSYSVDQDTTLTINAPGVLGNDSDIDGDAISVSLVSGPTSGFLTLNPDGSFEYTPAAGFSGNDNFTYQAVDSSAVASDTVTVSLQVNAVVAGPNLSHGDIASVNGNWQTVSLGKSYTSAVVVATPRYNSNSGPGVVRISNVTSSSFDVRVDNVGASAFDGGIHFIAMEEGVYDVPGEYKLEAVKVDASATSRRSGWQINTESYAQSYSNPVVVGQVMSANDEDWSVFWSSSSSRTSPANSHSLNVGKHVAEDSDTTRATETLGYFVIESTSSGTIDGLNFTAGVGGDTIRGVGNGTYQYSNVSPSGATTAVLSSAGMDGNDGGWAVLRGDNPLISDDINLSIDEDQFRDSERNHTTEQVAYFVIGGMSGEGEADFQASPHITFHDPVDVNGDGLASPVDALQVINRLNSRTHTSGSLGEEGDMALDTSGDGQLSPLDALLVINHLNANSVEGEASPGQAQQFYGFDSYFGDLEDDEESFPLFGEGMF